MRTMRVHLAIATLAVAFFVSGCGDLKDLPTAPIDDGPPDSSATFTRVQTEVFKPNCALSGCHDAFTGQEGLVLAAGSSYALLVDVQSSESSLDRIEPGSPEASYLYRKITGASGIAGDRMPQGKQPLSAANIKLVRDWIRRGAPND